MTNDEKIDLSQNEILSTFNILGLDNEEIRNQYQSMYEHTTEKDSKHVIRTIDNTATTSMEVGNA